MGGLTRDDTDAKGMRLSRAALSALFYDAFTPMNRTPSALRAEESLALLDVEPGRFRYSGWRNITIGVWADQATGEAAQRVLSISRQMARNHPEGHSNVIFVLDGAPMPTPEANAVFTKVYDRKVSDLSCMAVVIEGGGFWASAIRSTITSLRMAAQSGEVRMNVHDNMEQVLEWFPAEHTRRTGVFVTSSELRNVLIAARALSADAP